MISMEGIRERRKKKQKQNKSPESYQLGEDTVKLTAHLFI